MAACHEWRGTDARREQLAANLGVVRRRIAVAAEAAGRDPDEITLVAVTKFFPASDVRLLADLGVRDVGENRHQEAADKAADCADLDLRWHFIGGLQSNKAAAVAGYADVVESVDRTKLVTPLNRGAHQRSHAVDVLLQVSLDPPDATGRAGADPAELAGLAADVEAAGMLRLRGLMAIAPLGEDPVAAYARLAEIRSAFVGEHPGCRLALGGDERRPGSRRQRRRDTRAVGHGGPRSEAFQQVMSPPLESATAGTGKLAKPEEETMSGAMRKIGEYLGLLEDTGRYDDELDEDLAYEAAAVGASPVRAAAPRRQGGSGRRPGRAPPPLGGPVGVVAELSRITTLHPRTYNEARTVGENFREGTPVIMNLSEMDDSDAKRLVDFAAGLVFATRGTIERVTNKVFLLSPPNVSVAAEDKQRIAENGFFNQS